MSHYQPAPRAFLRHRTVLALPDVVAARDGRRAPPYRTERKALQAAAASAIEDFFKRSERRRLERCAELGIEPFSAAALLLELEAADDEELEERARRRSPGGLEGGETPPAEPSRE